MTEKIEFSDASSWTDFSRTRNCEVAHGLDQITGRMHFNGDAIGDRWVEVRSFVGASGESHYVGVFSLSTRDSVASCDELLQEVRGIIDSVTVSVVS